METGIKGRRSVTVTPALTAQAMGSGELPVFATPALVALVEETAWRSVAPYLPEGQGTVGTLVNLEHLAATPVGMEVCCETELVEVDRRRLVFRATLRDSAGLVGQGTHERFVVSSERFLQKAEAKRG